ncbi:hypothetical protein CTEN210_05132 [Chaetoceros tenuissimus]|uniref:Uncharacterized protein n=1 Tax=Chaetoceros tenuissimus TaxID=426638 RepID=A0AAD3CMD8_9STRA|nr:hypothetical protein CTEN210_05132 [Chaetoceros tenuissimus]
MNSLILSPAGSRNTIKRKSMDCEERLGSTQMMSTLKRRCANREKATLVELAPHDYLLQICDGQVKPSLSIKNFFHTYTEHELESYSLEVTQAVRSENVEQLRELHKKGISLQCSNAFGESLLHMACRRGLIDIVRFLLDEADVDLRCKDDLGRTPLHDAFWTPTPNFELVELLISISPELLFFSDRRGHTPLQYTRREHWSGWRSFLKKYEDVIKVSLE